MQMKFDRNTCTGMLACMQEWDVFEQQDGEFKPHLRGGEEVKERVFVLDVPEHKEEVAEACVKACPVNAIEVIDE